ncbi:sulfatase-like hydrolase/transferase [Verrucomicrobia bacterium]|nr:sulfatase-like hydrolase/transferase [Verrucomicrobiota bacterium]
MKTLITFLAFVVLSIQAADKSQNSLESFPNFILFITDDISWDDLGCCGSKVARTPHLDQMAEQGMRFNNAYLSISSCSPSRCSIISGRYPHNTGAVELHTTLPADQPVFPEALQAAGYYTALSGKHHIGEAVDRGFNKVSDGKGPGKEELIGCPSSRSAPRISLSFSGSLQVMPTEVEKSMRMRPSISLRT